MVTILLNMRPPSETTFGKCPYKVEGVTTIIYKT